MYVICIYYNFHCSPAKKNCLDPHFSGAGDATGLYNQDFECFLILWYTRIQRQNFNLCKEASSS